VSLIDDCFFKEELDRGMIFQVRRSNFLTGKRSLNIIDEIEEREKIQRAFEEAEAKRDMTYEEYLNKYQDMIEGKIQPAWANSNPDGVPRSQHASRPVTGHEDAKSDNGSKSGNKSTLSKNKSGLNSMNATKEGFGDLKGDVHDLPPQCLLTFMKGNKISDLDKKYVALSHPFPLIEGEMVVFQPNEADQYDE
jgi:hypothetical protein